MDSLHLVDEKDPILRTKSVPWDFKSQADATILAKALTRLLIESGGVGLAANQVGLPFRVFVMGDAKTGYRSCFNPEIIKGMNGTQTATEGCLSFPNLLLDIERHSAILVRYYTETGDPVDAELNGLWARVFQHELDHVDGICFDARVSRLALSIAQRKKAKALKRMRNG